MGFLGSAGRIGAGVATGGLSELALNKGVSQSVFGGGGKMGLLGMGTFQPGDVYDPNAASYNNPNFVQDQQQLGQYLNQYQNRQSALGGADPFRANQQTLSDQLLAQSQGQGPSMVQSQLQGATDQNIAQQMAMAASNRGAGAGLNQRLAMQNAGNIQQQAANQSAALKNQEMLNAQAGLAGVSNQARGSDIQLGAANDAQTRYFQQAILDQQEQDRQAKMKLEQDKMNRGLGILGVEQKAYQSAAEGRQDLAGGLLGGAGKAMGLMA